MTQDHTSPLQQLEQDLRYAKSQAAHWRRQAVNAACAGREKGASHLHETADTWDRRVDELQRMRDAKLPFPEEPESASGTQMNLFGDDFGGLNSNRGTYSQ